MDQLKFVVLDEEDLEVASTHLQDAVVRVADILWRPQEKRLVVALNRFAGFFMPLQNGGFHDTLTHFWHYQVN